MVPPIVWGFSHPDNTCGRHAECLYKQPPPVGMNSGHVGNDDAPCCVNSIAALNPYQGRWTIKGRMTTKTDIWRYGAGKVFCFDLLDAEGGEIRGTCFSSTSFFFYQIAVGNVYLITRGLVKPAQNFNHVINEYGVLLDTSASIEICSSDDRGISW